MQNIVNPKTSVNGIKLLPLEISVKRRTWRMPSGHTSEKDEAFKPIRKQVLERDDHTCRYCGFRTKPNSEGKTYLEVNHLDDDHGNNVLTNLATACLYCHMLKHIGYAGMMDSAIIIYLPEIPQHYLNHLSRSILMAIIDGGEYSGAAQAIQSSLEARALYIEEVFGSGASDPTFFGQAILDSETDKINKNALSGIRLLPIPTSFVDIGHFWKDNAFSGTPIENWDRISPEINIDSIINGLRVNKEQLNNMKTESDSMSPFNQNIVDADSISGNIPPGFEHDEVFNIEDVNINNKNNIENIEKMDLSEFSSDFDSKEQSHSNTESSDANSYLADIPNMDSSDVIQDPSEGYISEEVETVEKVEMAQVSDSMESINVIESPHEDTEAYIGNNNDISSNNDIVEPSVAEPFNEEVLSENTTENPIEHIAVDLHEQFESPVDVVSNEVTEQNETVESNDYVFESDLSGLLESNSESNVETSFEATLETNGEIDLKDEFVSTSDKSSEDNSRIDEQFVVEETIEIKEDYSHDEFNVIHPMENHSDSISLSSISIEDLESLTISDNKSEPIEELHNAQETVDVQSNDFVNTEQTDDALEKPEMAEINGGSRSIFDVSFNEEFPDVPEQNIDSGDIEENDGTK